MNKGLLFLLFSFLSHTLIGQSIPDKTLEQFLSSLKSIDSIGIKKVNTFLFSPYGSPPKVKNFTISNGNYFKTEIDSLIGYRADVLISPLTQDKPYKKYFAILYKDYSDQKWKIYSFRENVNVNGEIAKTLDAISDTKQKKYLMYNYTSLLFLQVLAGQLNAAELTIQKIKETAEKQNINHFPSENEDIFLRITNGEYKGAVRLNNN